MNTLAISPDETLIGHATQNQLTLCDPQTGRQIAVDCDGPVVALAAANGELWVACGTDELELLRFDGAGNPLGSLTLGSSGERAQFSNRAVGRLGTVLLLESPVSLRPDCGALDAEALRPSPDFAAPTAEGEWLVVRDCALAIAGDDGIRELSAAPRLAGDQRIAAVVPLADGDALAVFIQGDDPGVWILDRRRGEVRRRIQTPGAEQVAFAGERSHALVLSEKGEMLTVYDLRFGKPVASHQNRPALLDVVIGKRSQRVAALRRARNGAELVCIDYRALLRPKSLSWTTPSLQVDEVPETEATEQVDRDIDTAKRPEDEGRGNGELLFATSGGGPNAALASSPLAAPIEVATFDPKIEAELEPPPLPNLLSALRPNTLPPIATEELALRMLENHLALVAAWLQRAITEGWDSGRIGFAAKDSLPFENEVHALLGASRGRAPEQLAAAVAEARSIEMDHDSIFRRDRRACEEGESEHALTPLAALGFEFGLSSLACDILLVVAAPAVWGELARLYGICSNDEDRPLCDEWLVAQILGRGRGGRREIAAELEPTSALVASGLVQVGRGRRPFASLSVHPLVVRRLYGESFSGDTGDDLVTPSDVSVPWSSLLYNCNMGELVRSLQRPARALRLVIRGKRGSGRRTLASALGHSSERRVALVDFGQVVREGGIAEALRRCTLRGWLPCIDNVEGISDIDPQRLRAARQALDNHSGPLLVRCGPQTTPPLTHGYLEVTLADLPEHARLIAWRRTLERHQLDQSCAARFATLYSFGPGTVERVVARAKAARGAGPESDRVDLTHALETGIRQVRGEGTTLAKRVTRLPSWSQVCLPDELLDSVREFIARVRHRRVVFDSWGFDRVMTSSRGITALFEGRPGTGKTMVAGAIARELGCDLYRVDLSSVLSKWIGETEKHLAEIFDAAEGGQMILLFDEADSLFAKRTEVKSSNDRFANIEVNYLLQRLDSFTGIAISTTNFGRSIDPAFKRRLSLRLSFPFPDEELRERLWRAHLPPELPTAGPLALDDLARRYKLSGGYIRNIVLRSAYLAAHEGRPLGQTHLERAVSLEYRATGKLSEGGLLE